MGGSTRLFVSLSVLLVAGCEPASGELLLDSDDAAPEVVTYALRSLDSVERWYDEAGEMTREQFTFQEYEQDTDVDPVLVQVVRDGELQSEVEQEIGPLGLAEVRAAWEVDREPHWITREWDEETRLEVASARWTVDPATPGANPLRSSTREWGTDRRLISTESLSWDDTGTYVELHQTQRPYPPGSVPPGAGPMVVMAERSERLLPDGRAEWTSVTSFDDDGLPVRTELRGVDGSLVEETFWESIRDTDGRVTERWECDPEGDCHSPAYYGYDEESGWLDRVQEGSFAGTGFVWVPHPLGGHALVWVQSLGPDDEPGTDCTFEWTTEIFRRVCASDSGSTVVVETEQELIALP